jgi:UDP-N-acetylglucosamine:LPS N-acetylglucosamine transferase
VLVPDSELDGARLDHELTLLLAEPLRLRAMGTAARARGQPDATARVADLVEAGATQAAVGTVTPP